MNTYLFAAYTIFMIILLLYFLLISKRIKGVEDKTEELEELLKELKGSNTKEKENNLN